MATSIDIDFVFRDERPVVDHTSSVESFDNKVDTVVHLGVDFNHSVLDDLHDR